ncbi:MULTISPECIES: hypothetical protein [Halomonas]|jgi:hypothetical protein|uniref:DUF2306 domain-containing protein n=3 Tax=Halomonas TaxID=2745 RepID=A0AAU7KDS9_9GAMM|nr:MULTISPECIES: hypothetical protein [Halomonas]MBR9771179.1 hypothetical protein [Gammaproteobacteria bacterium]KJZ14076.1 hypothetical protein TW86_10900 [Halomonas sp. S2151]MAR72748.1 hypothetical protein [Halomonas sp.]MAY70181.1 hypothetical protein [Halomonas sp.]MBR9880557.1 hypothetical protein [Gammaproteobacteria bacterium]|tara:strand:- start:1984 stop:2202 length:219 start_codon:yes stop_codon:yes gene_type:complete
MTSFELLRSLAVVFHLTGLLVCLLGLHLARHPQRRWPGRALALCGFIIAATPTLLQLFGIIEPVPISAAPPN